MKNEDTTVDSSRDGAVHEHPLPRINPFRIELVSTMQTLPYPLHCIDLILVREVLLYQFDVAA